MFQSFVFQLQRSFRIISHYFQGPSIVLRQSRTYKVSPTPTLPTPPAPPHSCPCAVDLTPCAAPMSPGLFCRCQSLLLRPSTFPPSPLASHEHLKCSPAVGVESVNYLFLSFFLFGLSLIGGSPDVPACLLITGTRCV